MLGTPPKAANNSNFLTSEAKLAFLYLRQAFMKAPILYYFDSKCYIRIKIDVFGFIIGGILSQPSPEFG